MLLTSEIKPLILSYDFHKIVYLEKDSTEKFVFLVGNVRESTRYVTVIPIDRRTHDESPGMPQSIQISSSPPFNSGHENNRMDLLSPERHGAFTPLNGHQEPPEISFSTDNRLKVPQLVIGAGGDTDSESKKQFKESKFSKMGGAVKLHTFWYKFDTV